MNRDYRQYDYSMASNHAWAKVQVTLPRLHIVPRPIKRFSDWVSKRMVPRRVARRYLGEPRTSRHSVRYEGDYYDRDFEYERRNGRRIRIRARED